MAKGIVVCAQGDSYVEPSAIGTKLVKVKLAIIKIEFLFWI
jgi:hypothetical protein